MAAAPGGVCCEPRIIFTVCATISVFISFLHLLIIGCNEYFELFVGTTTVNVLGPAINLLINFFVIYVAAARKDSMFKIALWLSVVSAALALICMIVSIALIEHGRRKRPDWFIIEETKMTFLGPQVKRVVAPPETLKMFLAAAIIFFLLTLGVQAVLAWQLYKTVKGGSTGMSQSPAPAPPAMAVGSSTGMMNQQAAPVPATAIGSSTDVMNQQPLVHHTPATPI